MLNRHRPCTKALKMSALCSLLAACSSWPREGEGGFAEHDHIDMISVEHRKELKSNHGLRFDYTMLKHHLELLKLRGAAFCFPASVDDADKLELRIGREVYGQLYSSASANIVKQRIALDRLEHQLKLVIEDQQCRPPFDVVAQSERDEHSSAKVSLNRLLNSDNQFATSSAVLNPKYEQNLAAAAKILHTFPDIKLIIVGHTDEKGSSTSNLQLSSSRAKMVKQYLHEQGVPESAMLTIASGEAHPLFEGESAPVRLVNRSVQVLLTEG